MQSTDTERTLMSSYSELAGLYPPNTKRSDRITPQQEANLAMGQKSSPALKIRKRKAKDLFNYCYLHRTQHFHKHAHDDYTLWENGREIDELVMIPTYSIFSSIDEVGFYACEHTRTSYKALQRN
jgi:hypothetical protein